MAKRRQSASFAMRFVAAVCLLALLAGCAEPYVATVAPPPPPPAPVYSGPWPGMEDAKIRPGVQVNTPIGDGGGSCTSNFLFRTPDNRTLFLGIAAHCFGIEEKAKTGAAVTIAGIANAGRIAYNGWEGGIVADDDCGLVQLSNTPVVRSRVHPAVMYFGGPTAIADSAQAIPGTHVLTYGNSAQRSPTDVDNPREGYVLQKETHRTVVATDHPGIQGDSGSGLMTASGLALGVLSMGTTNPAEGYVANRDFPAVNYYVDLDHCVELFRAQPGLDALELVPWPLMDDGELPTLPGPPLGL